MKILDKNGYVRRQTFEALEKAWEASPPALLAESILGAVSDLLRYNTIFSVARAGTGHLGASLSIIEMLTCIYFMRFNFSPKSCNDKNRDIFILSKGHAVPALYAALAAKGYIKTEQLDNLRRLDGLQGHCDISTSGIEANTGSLAMGLSRAVGYALAKKRMNLGGKVIVIAGDGELQEGQVWEALLSAVSHKLSNLYIIIDHNKVQTDQYVWDITKYNDIYKTMKAMGFAALQMKVPGASEASAGFDALDALDKSGDKPKVFITDTIKGQGISFMEHTYCIKKETDRYIWHNKAPDADEMEGVYHEILGRVRNVLLQLGAEDKGFPDIEVPKQISEPRVAGQPLTAAFSKALLEAGVRNKKIVVFDADLEADCGLTPFRECHTERFFEMGIMEQHMVSAAAAFARMGYFPVINSYAAFLTSRANEQIYNYATEGYNGIFAGHMAGVIPATPGKSHQAYRDIACMKNIPGLMIYQPATPNDTAGFMKRAFSDGGVYYLRMSMAAPAVCLPDAPVDLPAGVSYIMKEGTDAIVYGTGPVVLGECMLAAKALEKKGISIEVRNHPWLNAFDRSGLIEVAGRGVPVLVVEDHFKDGGFGEGLFAEVAKIEIGDGSSFLCETEKKNRPRFSHIAIESFTTTGMRYEVLKHFGIDRDSIARKLREIVGN